MADERLRSKSELKRLFTNLKRKGITDEMISILIDVLWRDKVTQRTSGFFFPGGTDSVISFSNATREFTITPYDPLITDWKPRFGIYSWTNRAVYHRRFETETVQLPNEEGLYCIFYKKGEESRLQVLTYIKNPTAAELKVIYTTKVIVSFIYWDATAGEALYFGDDRHGSEINPHQHWIDHTSEFGKKISIVLAGLEINEDGSSNTHAQFSISDGQVWHGDILLDIPGTSFGSTVPVLYFSGVNKLPRFGGTAGFGVHKVSTRLGYNLRGTSIVEADSGKFILYHIFATPEHVNDSRKLITAMGQNEYDEIAEALAGSDAEIFSIRQLMPQQGATYMGSIVYETSDDFTNAVKARIVGFTNDDHPAVTIEEASKEFLSINGKQVLKIDLSSIELTPGPDGDSAYQVWIAAGNTGTEQEFLDSLVGTPGAPGGDGVDGDSAYQVWIAAGNTGTEQEFLDSLVGTPGAPGDDGVDGDSAYQVWIAAGNTGTEQEFLDSLVGTPGAPGGDGVDGDSAYQVWIAAGNTGTEQEFLDSLVGTPGAPGDDGVDGDSAYQVWIAAGNTGTEQEFLDSLVGADGDDGVGFRWRGSWYPATAYAVNDVVRGLSGTYVCKLAHTSAGMDYPDSTPNWATYWDRQANDGDDGADGDDGIDGDSAYQVWLNEGNTGTEQDFLDSLEGPPGDPATEGEGYDFLTGTFVASGTTKTITLQTGTTATIAARVETSLDHGSPSVQHVAGYFTGAFSAGSIQSQNWSTHYSHKNAAASAITGVPVVSLVDNGTTFTLQITFYGLSSSTTYHYNISIMYLHKGP